MMSRLYFICLLVTCYLIATTQNTEFEIGHISAKEMSISEYKDDPEAEALLLSDEAYSYYDDEYKLITIRRIRIKILNQKGLDRGNISIPYYSKDGFEMIEKIDGITYNYNELNNIVQSYLDKKSVFTEKKDGFFSLKKFAMPTVKPGCIIEYTYVSTKKHYGGLDEWVFQSDIPVLKSSYKLLVVPTAEFAYKVQKKSDMNIIIKPLPDVGGMYFEMNNVPALRLEPYMDARRDYLQKVTFQLSGLATQYGTKEDVNTSWKSLAYDLMTNKEFGSQLDKDLKVDALDELVKKESSATEKVKVIFNYVKKNFAWNGYYGKYAPDGLKAVLDRKKGSAGELNLLLINFLKTAGIETYPVLAADRDYGKIDTLYPFIDRFNKVVAFSIADGKQFILDASEENCPAGLTPYSLLNTRAFLVDKKNYNLIKIATASKSFRNMINMNGEIKPGGLLVAATKIESFDYAKQLYTDKLKQNSKKFVSDYFEQPYEGLTLDSTYNKNMDDEQMPLEQGIKFHQQLNESGGFVLLNYNLFIGYTKNPFTSTNRFTNINFGYPYNISFKAKIKLLPGSKVDNLPENEIIEYNNGAIKLIRNLEINNGEIEITITLSQTITLVLAEKYNELKDFYKKMVDLLNEPVVIKLGN